MLSTERFLFGDDNDYAVRSTVKNDFMTGAYRILLGLEPI